MRSIFTDYDDVFGHNLDGENSSNVADINNNTISKIMTLTNNFVRVRPDLLTNAIFAFLTVQETNNHSNLSLPRTAQEASNLVDSKKWIEAMRLEIKLIQVL